MRIVRAVSSLVVLAAAALSALFPSPVEAQANHTTTVTLNNILANGSVVQFGRICAIGGDKYGTPLTFSSIGWGVVAANSAFCANVVSGAMASGLPVPDANQTNRVEPIAYTFSIQLTDSNFVAKTAAITLFANVQNVTGPTFSLDGYTSPTSVIIPPGNALGTGSGVPASCTAPSIWIVPGSPATIYVCNNGIYTVGTTSSSSIVYGTAQGTAVVGNDARILAALKNQGTFSLTVPYSFNDVVTDSTGATYFSIVPGIGTNTGNAPSTTPSDWKVIGGGIGGLSATPTVTQNVLQPAGTSLNVSSLNELLNPELFAIGSSATAQFAAAAAAAGSSARGGGVLVVPPSFSGAAARLTDGSENKLCVDYDSTTTGPQAPGQSLPWAFGQFMLSDCSQTTWLNATYYPYRAKLLVADDYDFNKYSFADPEAAAGALIWHMVRGTPRESGPIDGLTVSGPWPRQGFNSGVAGAYTTAVEAQPTLEGFNMDANEQCIGNCIGAHVELGAATSSYVANFITNGNQDQQDVNIGHYSGIWAQAYGGIPDVGTGRGKTSLGTNLHVLGYVNIEAYPPSIPNTFMSGSGQATFTNGSTAGTSYGSYCDVVNITAFSFSNGNLTLTAANHHGVGDPIVIAVAGTDPLAALNGLPLTVLSTGLSGTSFQVAETAVTGSGSTVAQANAGSANCFNGFSMVNLPIMICPTAGVDCNGRGGTLYDVAGSTSSESVTLSASFTGATGIYYWYFAGEKLAIHTCCSNIIESTGGERDPMLDPRGGGGTMFDTTLQPPSTNPDPQTTEIWFRNKNSGAPQSDGTYAREGFLIGNDGHAQWEQACTTHFTASFATNAGVPTMTVTSVATTADECPGGLLISQSVGPDNTIWGFDRFGVIASTLTGTGGVGTYTLSQDVGTVASTSMRAYGRTAFLSWAMPSTPVAHDGALTFNGYINAQGGTSLFYGITATSGQSQFTADTTLGGRATTGNGAAITTGPVTTVPGDLMYAANTTGAIGDSGIPYTNFVQNGQAFTGAAMSATSLTVTGASTMTNIVASGTITAQASMIAQAHVSGAQAIVAIPFDDLASSINTIWANHANSAAVAQVNDDGSAAFKALSLTSLAVNSGATNLFNVAASTGNTAIGGTFDAYGASEIHNTFKVDGIATLAAANAQALTATSFQVNNGATNLFNISAATGNTAVGGTFDVYGVSEVHNNLKVDGTTTFGSGTGAMTLTNATGFNFATPLLSVGTGMMSAGLISTNTDCESTAASPVACGAAAAGKVQIPAAATTITINTTAATANVHPGCLTYDTNGLTPPTNAASLVTPYLTGFTAGTNFTLALPVAPAGHPVNLHSCLISN